MTFRSPLIALALAAAVIFPQEAAAAPAPETSILRVNITSQGYNFALPWQKQRPGTRRGLGALLEGNRVLVTAELAQDATYIELEQAASGERITAKVEAIDYEVNLATVVPVDPPGDFFKNMEPLVLDTTIKPKVPLEVWQFENNGAPVTSTVDFDRVDLGSYFLEDQIFLVFQANGAVQYRSGTFTLPVIHKGRLAGMLIRYNSRDQVSDILPAPMIENFLKDVAQAPYEGLPNFGVRVASTLDPQLRSYLKLDKYEGGVLITSVTPGFSAAVSGVKEGDVVVEINGYKLDARGYYQDPAYGLLGLGHLVRGGTKVGDTMKVKLIRDGKPMDLDVKMLRTEAKDYLVDPYVFDRQPRYVILGGLLFQELTLPYLQLAGKDWKERAPFRLTYAQANQDDFLKAGRKKLVFISGVLPAPCTIGYERMSGLIVNKVNGKDITDLATLAEAIKVPEKGIHKIEVTDGPRTIYLDDEQARQDNADFLPSRYRITEMEQLK
ncbi:MAG: PDZ domain-containing protein [Verrucomicrobiota bacterium]